MTDIRMYILTTKVFYAPEDPMYRPLQVGSILHEDLGYERDDKGDHISERYERFQELTGLYWIWKNVKCDVVGISMANHYFCYYEDVIRKYRIESLLNQGFDVILPKSKASSCMLIARKEVFDAYCMWLFEKLFEIDSRENKDAERPVELAKEADRLTSRFFENSDYRIITEMTVESDLHLYQEAEEAVKTKRDLLKKMLGPLINAYAVGNPVDLIPLKPYAHDFHGKLPVWICWWQGKDAMPPIVKACFESLRRNLPKEQTEIRLITFENVDEYIRFPDFIEEKYRKGEISLIHLSDILRMSLLTLYGGFWLDATYLLTTELDEELIIGRDFYTQKFEELRYSDEMVVNGRWAGNLLYAKPWNVLTRFVLNGFYCYWAINNVLMDYFLIDYLIMIAYEEIPSVREMIESCPPSEPNVFELEPLLNEAYDEDEWKRLTGKTSLFKLSYKHIFKDVTEDGRETFYRRIIKQYED